MLRKRVNMPRLVGRKMLAQVLQRFARDGFDRQLARDAVLELVRHEVEIHVAVQHGRLLVKQREHVFLERRAGFCELIRHGEQLPLHDVCRFIEIDDVRRLREHRQELAEGIPFRLRFLITLEHVPEVRMRLV